MTRFYKESNHFINNPDSITTDGKFALLSGVYFWNSKELYKIADKQSENNTNEIVKQITKKVNGGNNGLSERTEAFKRIHAEDIFKDFRNNE